MYHGYHLASIYHSSILSQRPFPLLLQQLAIRLVAISLVSIPEHLVQAPAEGEDQDGDNEKRPSDHLTEDHGFTFGRHNGSRLCEGS